MNLNFSIKDLWDRLKKDFISKSEVNEWKISPEVILLDIKPGWEWEDGIAYSENLHCSKSNSEIIDLVTSGVQVILRDTHDMYYYPTTIERDGCLFSNVDGTKDLDINLIHIHRSSEANFRNYSIASTAAMGGLEDRMDDLETALESMRQDMLDNELVTTQAIQALAPSNS